MYFAIHFAIHFAIQNAIMFDLKCSMWTVHSGHRRVIRKREKKLRQYNKTEKKWN